MPFKPDPKVDAVNKRGDIIRQTNKDVLATLRTLVNQLCKKYPDQIPTIRHCLIGEADRLLSEAEETKRKAREAAREDG